MAASNWKPGFRRTPPGTRLRIGKAMTALANVWNYKVSIFAYDPNEDFDASELDDGLTKETIGKDIFIHLSNASGRAFPINLSTLTVEELNALHEVIEHAFTAARPIVEERDRIAEKAAADGNDTFHRRHRSSPKVSYFPGKV